MDQLAIRRTSKIGLIAGCIALSICMIGLVEAFNERDVISDVISLGRIMLFAAAPVAGYIASRRQARRSAASIALGLLAGLLTALPVFSLILLTLIWTDIRSAFINVSPALMEILTLGQASAVSGGLLLATIFTLLGGAGALFYLLPSNAQRALLSGLGWVVGIGVLSEILVNILRPRLSRSMLDTLFGSQGLQLPVAVTLFIVITAWTWMWRGWGGQRYTRYRTNLSPVQSLAFRRTGIVLAVLLVLVLPSLLGVYLSEIINNVALYILMGLGLNIAVGLAGLLDLGYVTNFAVGAYVMALLTSSSGFGIESTAGVQSFSFWMALPISVLAAMLSGFLLALPVLRMRGDYLAIATLGFGEIIRILARSDWLSPVIGGAQGILQIPTAAITGWTGAAFSTVLLPVSQGLNRFGIGILEADRNGQIVFGTPPQLYYLLVLACLLMLFISYRLNNSRTGRQWMAIREDEDVAAAMGIDTTKAKIIAFTLSAASGGLAGAIFAAKLGSIYPHSFQLLISVNVLSLIIVGGMGSILGVVVGAFALIGLPELLREFAEFRLLFYGIALILIMLLRPEGLVPSAVRRRELHSDAQDDAAPSRGAEETASPVVGTA